MALEANTTFGNYRIFDVIGEGGMGQVYRATDTTLKRDVAIKVLPESLAQDEDRLARFQREAETLASLNHPNIGMIFGLEKQGDTIAIVMELVEGPTLADRVAEGPIPPDEALRFANQIIDGLEAAHDQGIVHRDLKPANIKIRKDGQVKLLDFGIAKPQAIHGSSGQTPTLITPAVTETGMILGTAAYMSPEQARGREVDQRTDIWAFGCLLFEMLTGQPAFGGEDVATTMARILEREADMASLPDGLSPYARQAIELCLVKDVRERLHAIGDVRLVLQGKLKAPVTIVQDGVAGGNGGSRFLPVAAAIVVTSLVVILVMSWFQPEAGPQDNGQAKVNRFTQILPYDQYLANGDRNVLGISPDGNSVVFALQDGLYVRKTDDFEPRFIPGTQLGGMPFFSPDGQWIGFTLRNVLYKIPAAGGIPVNLGQVGSPFGASWADDDTIVYTGEGNHIYRMASDGSNVQRIVENSYETGNLDGPQLLPGSTWVMFTEGQAGSWNEASVVAQSLDTGERKVLLTQASDARYVPTGHLLYVRGSALYAIPFDLETMTVNGQGLPVLDGLMRAPIVSASSNYDVSDNGTLAYARGRIGTDARPRTTPFWVDRSGVETPLPLPSALYDSPLIDASGERVLLLVDGDVVVWNFPREVLTAVTTTDEREIRPVWGPDDAHVTYMIPGSGNFTARADGAGTREALCSQSQWALGYVGGELMGTSVGGSIRATGEGGISLQEIPGCETSWLVTPRQGQIARNPVISPDGQWIAYESGEIDQPEIFVRAYPNVDIGLQRVSTAGGRFPVWSRDGGELFYLEPGSPSHLMAVPVTGEDTLQLGRPTSLLDWYYQEAGDNQTRPFDIAPDGQRFLVLKPEATPPISDLSQLSRVNVIQNWFTELNRLVPTE